MLKQENIQKLHSMLLEEKKIYLNILKQAKLQDGLLNTNFDIASLRKIIKDRDDNMQKIAKIEDSILSYRDYWTNIKDSINDDLGIKKLFNEIADILKEILIIDERSNKILEKRKVNIKIKAEEITSSKIVNTAYKKQNIISKKIGVQFKSEA